MLCTIPNEDRRKLSRKGVIFGLILCFLRKFCMEMLFALFLHEVMAYGWVGIINDTVQRIRLNSIIECPGFQQWNPML
jgi:hypothetical protein